MWPMCGRCVADVADVADVSQQEFWHASLLTTTTCSSYSLPPVLAENLAPPSLPLCKW